MMRTSPPLLLARLISTCLQSRVIILIVAAALLVAIGRPSAGAVATVPSSTQPVQATVPFISPDISVQPPEGLLIDAWYRLQLLDQPMGYMRTSLKRAGDRMESLDYTMIRVARGPITIKVIIKTVTAETVDGRPLEIHTEQVMGSQPMKYDAVFRNDGTIDLQITQGNNVIHRQIRADPTAVLPWKKTLDILQGQRKPGESFVDRSYAFVSDTKPLEVTNDFLGKTQFALPTGRIVPALRYKVTNRDLAGSGEVLCEPQLLTPLKLDIPVLGSMVLTATIASRDQAMATDSGKTAELFESLMLHAKVAPARDPSQAGSVLYTMKVKGDAAPVDLVTTGMQRVVNRQPHLIELLVTRRAGASSRGTGVSSSSAELAACRKASAYANSDDPLIRQMAVEAAGKDTEPLRVAENLTRFVYGKMKHKNLDIAFATASEAARTLEGDCTEHAVLLAALARAKGLPARGVLGMVAMPGSYDHGTITFGYHMWTQIYVNNRWMDFDAALNQPRPDATHIALGISDLSDSAMPQGSVKTFAQIAGSVQMTAEPKQ